MSASQDYGKSASEENSIVLHGNFHGQDTVSVGDKRAD